MDVAQVAAAIDEPYAPMVWLGAVFGLRWDEVAGVTIGSLNLLEPTLAEANQLGRDGELGEPKSAAGASFHDLRRLDTTKLVRDGVDVMTAQARLGHSDLRLTPCGLRPGGLRGRPGCRRPPWRAVLRRISHTARTPLILERLAEFQKPPLTWWR